MPGQDPNPPRYRTAPEPRGGDHRGPRLGNDTRPHKPGGGRRGGGHVGEPFPFRGDGHHPGDKWRPPHRSRRAGGHGGRYTPQYHHYYYRSHPRQYVYGGWGAGWYDPWWWGNYYWPRSSTQIQVHHYYDNYIEVPIRETRYYEDAQWIDTELHTTLTDIAVAWTTGDVELLQAHLTPGAGVAIQHDWEQEDPWILAAPVMLDLMLDAFDAQVKSEFRFVQVEEMEPGLVWAIAEHEFELEGERPKKATMEFMFRSYENAWLVEAVVADPANYWWVDAELLDDAARESARLLDEMDEARAAG